MKHTTLLALATTLLTMSCAAENEGPEIIIDPVMKIASISVVNVSGQSNIPSEIQIDGLYDNKNSLGVGSGGQEVKYAQITAGLRNVALGSYKDTVRLDEHNYYTLMIYDNDSLRLSLDAPYGSTNQFATMPQVRWNITGANPQDYKVDIHSDSVLRDIAMDKFTSVNNEKEVKVSLYRRDNPGNLLGEKALSVDMNKKATVNIRYNASADDYDFTTITQSVQ